MQRCTKIRSSRLEERSGRPLFEARARLGLTLREVEERSREIARRRRNPDYIVHEARLSQIENSDTLPRLHKLAALSEVYLVPLPELLSYYGIDLDEKGLPRTEETPAQALVLSAAD